MQCAMTLHDYLVEDNRRNHAQSTLRSPLSPGSTSKRRIWITRFLESLPKKERDGESEVNRHDIQPRELKEDGKITFSGKTSSVLHPVE